MPTRRIIIVIVIALVTVAVWRISTRGRVRHLADVGGEVRQLTPAPSGLLWVEAPAQPGAAKTQLRFLPWGSRKAPVTLLEAYDIRSLAVHGPTVYAAIETDAGETSGQVVSVPVAGGAPTALLTNLHSPQGLIASETSMCWAETRAAPVAGVAHVPILGQLAALRIAPMAGGKPSADAGLLAMAESAEAHYDGQLLGVRDGQVYWTERFASRTPGARTYFRRAAERGGEPQTLGLAKGLHQAALGEKALYWTAYSEELAEPTVGRVVRRLPLGGGEVETLTDWLTSFGTLMTDHGRAFYAGEGWLWAVPDKLAKPVPLVRCGASQPGTVALCGGNVVGVSTKDKAKSIVRAPYCQAGRVTAALPGALGRAASRGEAR